VVIVFLLRVGIVSRAPLERAREPRRREGRHLLEGARLLEEMGGTRDDSELVPAGEQASRLAVELEDDPVGASDDEESRRAHPREPRRREVRTAAPGDHRGDLRTELRGRDERRGGARARAEVASSRRCARSSTSKTFRRSRSSSAVRRSKRRVAMRARLRVFAT
jgi:hypothetical protein